MNTNLKNKVQTRFSNIHFNLFKKKQFLNPYKNSKKISTFKNTYVNFQK